MKKLARGLGLVLGALAFIVGGLALYIQIRGIPRYEPPVIPAIHVEPTPERLARGKQLVSLTCAGCHADPKTGKLTGKRMADLPPEFGVAYSKNITGHPTKGIGAWSDGQIEVLLRTGLKPDGQYLPPWMVKMPHLADEDMHSIVAFLRSGDPMVAAADVDPVGKNEPSFLAKVLSHVAFKPLPYPTEPIVAPPRSDRVAYGRYMVFALDCFSCHSPDFKKVDFASPEKTPGYLSGGNEMLDMEGRSIRSANITPDDETGIGRWSEAEFVRAVKQGFRPDGRMLHYPMEVRPELGDDEAGAMYAYLRTVPALKNAVERRIDAVPQTGGEGQRLYASYGCVSCHGEKGVGLGGGADLRGANERYPSDTALRAWIDDAPRLRPGTRMPGWKGVIRENDYGPLMGYVRELAAQPPEASNR